MAIRGTFKYNFPIVLKEKCIRDLVHDLSQQHCESVTYSGMTVNGTVITFASADELFAYNNSDTSRLGGLTIQGFRGKKNTLRITFDGMHGIGTATKYPEVFICEYEAATEDDERSLDGKIKHFWDTIKAPYWRQGKYGQAVLQAAFIILALSSFIVHPPFRLYPESTGFLGVFLLLILLYILVLCFLKLTQWGVEKLFPPAVFLWNGEEKSYEHRKDFILSIALNLLSSGIYAGLVNAMVSGFGAFISRWLK